MADTETQEEDDIEVIETPLEGEEVETEETEGSDEDDRLAESEDEDDLTEVKRQKRRQKRVMRKRARDATLSELAELRQVAQLVPELVNRIKSLEGHAVSSTEHGIETQIAQKLAAIQQAEGVMASAIEEGNGKDAAKALAYRDQFRDELLSLQGQKERIAGSRQEQTRAPDPVVVSHASGWLKENSDWYDPQLGNEESRLAKQIDEQLTREGYNPKTKHYWDELQRRCDALFEDEPKGNAPPRRKAPPQGTSREHNPGKSQFYVSPERKKAMEEIGAWDDPKMRNEMIREYQRYDRENAAR